MASSNAHTARVQLPCLHCMGMGCAPGPLRAQRRPVLIGHAAPCCLQVRAVPAHTIMANWESYWKDIIGVCCSDPQGPCWSSTATAIAS